jgi:hypothetical protein
MNNAFENSEQQPIPEVEDPIKAARLTDIEIEIHRIEAINESLRSIGLHRTADLNTRKLNKLLQEKRELLVG